MKLFKYYFKNISISIVSLVFILTSSFMFFNEYKSYYINFPVKSEKEFKEVQEKNVLTEMMNGVYLESNEEIRDAFRDYYSDRSKYSSYENKTIDQLLAIKDYKPDGYFDYFHITNEMNDFADNFILEMNSIIEENIDTLSENEKKTFEKMKKQTEYGEYVSYIQNEDTPNISKLINTEKYQQFHNDLNFVAQYNITYDEYSKKVSTLNLSKDLSYAYLENTSSFLSMIVIIFIVFQNIKYNRPKQYIQNSSMSTRKQFLSKVLAYISYISIIMFIQMIIHLAVIYFKIDGAYKFNFLEMIPIYLMSLVTIVFVISFTEFLCAILKKEIFVLPIGVALQFAAIGPQNKVNTLFTVLPRTPLFSSNYTYDTLVFNRAIYFSVSVLILIVTYKILKHKRNNI